MDPLSATGSIISILQLSNKVVGYLNDVKDASKERAKCAVEASNLHSLLVNLRFHLEEGNADTPWYTAVRALAVENGPLDQFKQALEKLQSKMTGGGQRKKAGKALVWKFKKEEIASILGRMERLKTVVGIAFQMDHRKLSQAIKDNTDTIKNETDAIKNDTGVCKEDINTVRIHTDTAEHHRLLEWISPTDYPSQQSDIIKRRQEGTCRWFLDADEIVRWLSETKQTLFCPGIPGAGKTMVAAIAIDHLLNSVQNDSCGVSYVYCNYKAQEEQDVTSMLASILKQLVKGRPIMETVQQLYKKHNRKGTRPSLHEMFETLRDVLASYSTVYIVIDALDECREGIRRQFLAKLRDLREGRDIRLMVTSRFIPEIVDAFKAALTLEVQANEEDVKRFVAGQTYHLPRCIQRDPALQNMVQDMIAEAVGGMFLLARLHTDSLLDKRTAKDVKLTLSRLKGSATIDEAYTDALKRIKGQLPGDYKLAKKTISWITCAKRPLTTDEICCALAVELGESKLDSENIPDVEDLVSVCAGLVVVDPNSAIIRLVHYTTQEYFERIIGAWNPTAQVEIASTCLTYLSFKVFESGCCPSHEGFKRRLRKRKLLDYAAKNWGEHAANVQGEVRELARSFLLQIDLVHCAAQAMTYPRSAYQYMDYRRDKRRRTTPLHLAARSGLYIISEPLIPRNDKKRARMLQKRDVNGMTPLHLAIEYGHYRMVDLLLKKGTDVNVRGGGNGDHKPILAASEKGHIQIVRLLVDKGADVNAQGERFENALLAAVNGGHEQVLRLLIDNGADVNVQGRYGSVLYAASSKGYEQIVKLLVDKGANVNAQGGENGNALQAASSRGHEKIVRLLISKGANLNAQGPKFDNALHAASCKGYEHIVRLLIDAGANTNARGGEYRNALYAASFGGHERVVRLLVDNGADVNDSEALQAASFSGHEQIVRLLVDKGAVVNGSDALQVASFGGYEQIVSFLLEKGAAVNAESGKYGNALQAASFGGHERIVKMLVHRGADVNAKGREYSNSIVAHVDVFGAHGKVVRLVFSKDAEVNVQGEYRGNTLQAAVRRGNEQIVKLLIEEGADVNAQGGSYGNALQAASSVGHEKIVKVLLSKGADVNAKGGYYGNALQAASSIGHGMIVMLLLKGGADANAQGGEYGNALYTASHGGHVQIVRLLLDLGADVDAQDEYYGNALLAASKQGHEQVVRWLVDKGADVNAQCGYYGNALCAASHKGYEQIVRLLVDRGANVNAPGGFCGSALCVALSKGHKRIVKLLVDKGATIDKWAPARKTEFRW